MQINNKRMVDLFENFPGNSRGYMRVSLGPTEQALNQT